MNPSDLPLLNCEEETNSLGFGALALVHQRQLFFYAVLYTSLHERLHLKTRLLVVPVVTQWVKDATLSLGGCRFDPWPYSAVLRI